MRFLVKFRGEQVSLILWGDVGECWGMSDILEFVFVFQIKEVGFYSFLLVGYWFRVMMVGLGGYVDFLDIFGF